MDVVSARHLRDRLGIYRLPSHFSNLITNCRRLFQSVLLQKKIDIMEKKQQTTDGEIIWNTFQICCSRIGCRHHSTISGAIPHYRSSCGFNDTILSHYDRFYFQ